MPLLYTSFLGSGGGGGGSGPGSFPASAYQPVNLAIGTQIIANGSSSDFDEHIREIGNVIYDTANAEYRLVYTGYQGTYDGNDTFVGYAYSADGISWTKGGKLTLGADRNAEDPYLVKSGSTYYLYVEDKEDVPFRNIRLYTSTDFSTWTDQGDVIDIGTGWEAQDVSSPTVWVEGSTWHMLYEGRATNQAGAIGHATSSDGITWSKDGGNPVLVGQNPTFSYTGPIAWSDGIAPDDIVKIGSTYVLSFHGRKGSADVFYFRAGVATSTDLTTWTDALAGDQVFFVAAPDATMMYLPTADTLYFVYTMPGGGLMSAEEGTGDANWSSVVLYISGYGADGDTRFYDLSDSWHTDTAVGNAQIDTAQSKFGPASILLDGNGDRITLPDSANWDFGSGAFTVECWVRFAATETAANVICSQWANASRAFVFDYFNNTLRFSYSTNGTATAATLTFAWTQSGGTWFHFALTRDGSGDVRAFVDGVQVGTTQAANVTIFNSTAALWIGAIETATPGNDFSGHIEGLRFTKGVARYTANFTAPSALYPIGPQP